MRAALRDVVQTRGSAMSKLAAAPQLHVERAGAAMTHASLRETCDDGSELWLLEPMRQAVAKHAPPPLTGELAQPVRGLRAALAGDDEHALESPGMSVGQKGSQSGVGLPLVEAVQVNARVDLHLARGDLTRLAAIEVGEGRRLRSRRGDLGAACI